ncbi:MAG: tetratricopeptide repeat protein [Moheibacter sp.]
MRRLLLILIFGFSLLFTLTAQEVRQSTNEYSKSYCQQLMNKAWEAENEKKYNLTLELLLKAELIATENRWDDLLWDIKNNIGLIYYYISNFGEAHNYFQESYSILQKNNDLKEKLALPLINIAILYTSEQKYEEALYYYKKANEVVNPQNKKLKKHIAGNMAEVYLLTDRVVESFSVLLENAEEVEDSRINFLWQSMYIQTLIADGQIDKAQKLADDLYSELDKGAYENHRDKCYPCILTIFSKIYEAKNEYDTAISYAKKALNKSDELIDHVGLYESLTEFYLKKTDYKTALQYKDSVLRAKDSLANKMNMALYESNKVKFKIKEYEHELNNEKKRKKTQVYIFTGILLISIISFLSIYKTLKNRIVKQKQKLTISSLIIDNEKQDRLLVEQQLEIKKLEVGEKNRELTTKALYVTKRNNLIKDIIHSIEAKSEKYRDNEIGKLIRTIKNMLNSDDRQEDFMGHFERVNPHFLKQLKKKHPELTSNDIRFLCYVFMNLNMKEISGIFNITYNACKKRKWKIQEKIGLQRTDSLYDYLFSLETTHS